MAVGDTTAYLKAVIKSSTVEPRNYGHPSDCENCPES